MDLQIVTVAQLSAHLRALRKARKLTQADLGRLLDVKQSRIADIESDPGSVSVSQFHKLLSALGTQMLLRDAGSAGWVPTERPGTKQARDVTQASAGSLSRHRAEKKSTGSW